MPAWLLSPFAKIGGGVLLAGLIVFGINRWLDARDDAAFDRGKAEVAEQLREATTRANASERALEIAMGITSNLIGQRAEGQTSALTIKLDTLQKDLNREVQADLGARTRVSDGVRHNLETQRATVNTSVATSDPGQPGSTSADAR